MSLVPRQTPVEAFGFEPTGVIQVNTPEELEAALELVENTDGIKPVIVLGPNLQGPSEEEDLKSS